ncbi:DUF6049 family protein [Nocardioides terrae]|nr:DUF6049 family protein [Nocardioides terrae]
MPRPRAALRRARTAALIAVIGGLLSVFAGLVPSPAYAARKVGETTPLTVTIDSLSPSAIAPRRKGTITVTGTVTNTDDAPWVGVALYPFASASPMTTTAELAEAARSEETVEVGDRILADKVDVGDLEPGQTARYTIVVPRRDLVDSSGVPVTAPGVYWFGVHALGSGPEGNDDRAHGRARTFLPLLPANTPPVRAAVIAPLRVHIVRSPDGRLAPIDAWQRLLSSTGRLGRARATGTSVGGSTLSWLVDPAVLDALRQLAAGNPPRDISPTDKPADGATGSPSPTAAPSPSASPTPEPDPETATVAALASSWLDAMVPVLQRSEVLALPYGDLDLSAAASRDPDIYETARTRSISLVEDLDIPATQVNAAPRGLQSQAALRMGDPATPTVLSSAALPDELGWGTESTPAVVDANGRRLVVSSAGAGEGGPGPGDPQADVPLRQRILAEAAVRAIDPARPPLVVTLPQRWNPENPTAFVTGLAQPWLELAGLSAAVSGQVAPAVDPADVDYPTAASRDEQPAGRFTSAEALIRTGRTLQRVLTRNDTVASEVVDEALTNLSYSARGSVGDASAASRGWMLAQLGQIRIEGPDGLTLSGSSGRFPATVVNGLDQPVTVAIRAASDPGIDIRAPKSVQVAANSRVTVSINARGARAGVHNVALQVYDSDRTPLGGSVQVSLRAAQVSNIIWLFLGVGGALLFGAIGVRVVRRLRASRGGDRPPAEAAPAEARAHAGE